jgi:hypothetical protein
MESEDVDSRDDDRTEGAKAAAEPAARRVSATAFMVVLIVCCKRILWRV